MTRTETEREERVAADFKRLVAEHTFTVLHEDGLYRHWRCQHPGTYVYGFDIVTWPGYLTVCGDIGCWPFARTENMVAFFGAKVGYINPHYWSEKLVAGGSEASEFSASVFHRQVAAWVGEQEDVTPDLIEWARGVLQTDPFNVEEAYELVREVIREPWDTIGPCQVWSTRFLYACHGIVWAIDKRGELGE